MGRRMRGTLAGMIRNEVRQVIQAELAPLLRQELRPGPGQGGKPEPPQQGQDSGPGRQAAQSLGQGREKGAQPLESRPAITPGQISVLEQAILDALVRQGTLLMDSGRQGSGQKEGGSRAGGQGRQAAGGQNAEHSGVLARLAHLLGLGTGGEGVQRAEDAVPGRGVPPVLSPDGYEDAGSSTGDTTGGAGGSGGGVPGGQGAPGLQEAGNIYKELEVNLLKLRQVIQESEALALRLEKLLHDDAARPSL